MKMDAKSTEWDRSTREEGQDSSKFYNKVRKVIMVNPVARNCESFKYLGCFFNFEMDNHQRKIRLESSLLHMMKLIDLLIILPKNRLKKSIRRIKGGRKTVSRIGRLG